MEESIRELKELSYKYHELEKKHYELKALVRHYEERERLSNQKKFGSSSEKSDYLSGQLKLLDEAETKAAPKTPGPTVEEITYTRRKQSSKRSDNLSGLPVERIEYIIPEEERVCPECG